MITDHHFVGLRQWGINPSPDKPCQHNPYGHPSGVCGHRLDEHAPLRPMPTEREIELTAQLAIARHEIGTERDRAAGWRKLANGYDDIRSWLRLCEDTPEGHKEFYDEATKIIFPSRPPRRTEADDQS